MIMWWHLIPTLYILFLGKLVDRFLPEEQNKEKIIDFLDKASDKIIQPFIDKQYASLA